MSAPMPAEQQVVEAVEELKQLLAKATPGPWEVVGAAPILYDGMLRPVWNIYARGRDQRLVGSAEHFPGDDFPNDNARLIVALRNLVPALLADRDNLLKEVEKLRLATRGDEKGIWSQEVRDAVDALEDRYEIDLCSSAFAAKHNRLREAAEATVAEMRAWNEGREAGFIKPDNAHQVFFYEQDFYVLSNFSAFAMMWPVSACEGDKRFDTSEAVYHFEKFICRGRVPNSAQRKIAEEIRLASSAHEAFKIAERHKSLRRRDWDEIKVGVMKDILRAKANQHEYVRRKLLATGDRDLIEDSWRDDFWGWGPNRDGQNMLGKLWMEVRAELRALSLKENGNG